MKLVSAVLALLGVGVLLAVVLTGGGVAGADVTAQVSADTLATPVAGPEQLLDDLAALESALPEAPPPTGVEIDPTATWGRLEGDAGAARARLDTVEPDLRALFVAADDADGEVADAVALVARGWLDVWSGLAPLSTWETNDLEFPSDTDDVDGVATGGDELRGAAERGLEQVLTGQRRLRDGYGRLRTLGAAAPEHQVTFDVRAAQADAFDADVRPLVRQLLSQTTPTVLVTTERFGTTAPGAQARARSSTVVCVDRESLEALGRTPDPQELAALADAARDRVDCPDLSPAGSAP
ncbi:MAG TPA: hypothetical protein VK906_16800 [Egicoccus sp.]|nr:hypothetical protein [Egicoccus sp.]HSK24846.1 hypothetical protein [Egicoccus sp.]